MRVRVLAAIACSAAVLAALPVKAASAAGGDLDPAWGQGGLIYTSSYQVPMQRVLPDADGYALLAVTGGFVHIDSGGNLFGGGGDLYLKFATGAALDPQGRLVMIGKDSNTVMRVARFAHGVPDPTFGGTGGVSIPMDWRWSSLAIAPDGSIAVAGGSSIAKFTPNGTLDPTWNPTGPTPGIAPQASGVTAMAFQSTGALITLTSKVAALTAPLVRYTPSGQPDPSFGVSGTAQRPPLDPTHQMAYRDIAVGPDDRIYATGGDFGTPAVDLENSIAVRLTPDGLTDPSWAGGGVAVEGGQRATGSGLVFAGDGSVYVGAVAQFAPAPLRVYKYTRSGVRDFSFGHAGLAQLPAEIGATVLDGLAAPPSGGLLVATHYSTSKVYRISTRGVAAPAAVTASVTSSGVRLQWTNPASASFATSEVRMQRGVTAPSPTTGTVGYSGTGATASLTVPTGSDAAFTVLTRDFAGNPSATATFSFHGTHLTGVPRSAIGYGTSRTLTTVLRRANGTRLSSAPVTVYARPHGTAPWKRLTTLTTNRVGAVSLRLTPSASEDVQFTFAGKGVDLASSTATTILVSPSVSARWSTTSTHPGSGVRVTGVVRPNEHGQFVYLQRFYRAGWHTVARVRLSNAGTYSLLFKAGARGRYYYRLYRPADALHVAGASPRALITVS